MSRVYEALKRAEGLRAVDEVPRIEIQATSQAVRPLPANRSHFQVESSPPDCLPIEPLFVAPDCLPRSSNAHFSQVPLESKSYAEGLTRSYGQNEARNVRAPQVVSNLECPKVAEQFHRLSLNIRTWSTDNDKRVFTIISALSQDGKSFVALNLAASLAMNGDRVILVDADLRQPVLQRSFDIAPIHGLISYLKGESTFDECLQPTAIPGVLLVAAGGISTTPVQLLSSARMQYFIHEARLMSPAHYVIIDSPASSAVTDPEILSRLADASLVVVAANRTPRELVKQTIALLEQKTLFGLVLNDFEPGYSALSHYPDRYAAKRGWCFPKSPRLSSVAGHWKGPFNLIRFLMARIKLPSRSNWGKLS
jgi:capsular exopolysaccharide synthesis family protein